MSESQKSVKQNLFEQYDQQSIIYPTAVWVKDKNSDEYVRANEACSTIDKEMEQSAILDSEIDEKYKSLCCFFIQGRCTFSNCRFSHDHNAIITCCTYKKECKHGHFNLGIPVSEIKPIPEYIDISENDLLKQILTVLAQFDNQMLVSRLGSMIDWKKFRHQFDRLVTFLLNQKDIHNKDIFLIDNPQTGFAFVKLNPESNTSYLFSNLLVKSDEHSDNNLQINQRTNKKNYNKIPSNFRSA